MAWFFPFSLLIVPVSVLFLVFCFNDHSSSFVVQATNAAAGNCTDDCLSHFRRQWPKLDFDFYYDAGRPNQSAINGSSSLGVPYTVQPEPSSTNFETETTTIDPGTTPRITISGTSLGSAGFHLMFPPDFWNMAPNDETSNNGGTTSSNCSTENLVEHYLLRTIFEKDPSPFNFTKINLTENFRDKMFQIYNYRIIGMNDSFQMESNRTSSSPEPAEPKIWTVTMDDQNKTVEVVYNLRRNGTFLNFFEADQLISLIPDDVIQNLTGFRAISKVEPYIVRASQESRSISSPNWINLATLLIGLALLMFLFLLFGLFFYCMFKRERRQWMETMNREITRVIPNRAQDQDDRSTSNWNSSADDLSTTTSTKKLDKGSQYDYFPCYTTAASSATSVKPSSSSWANLASKMTPPASNKERLIPVRAMSDDYYDRISYMHSRETIQETHKHPNILEIKLSEETQSIVKEIRKELDRYNQRKILNNVNNHDDTSDA